MVVRLLLSCFAIFFQFHCYCQIKTNAEFYAIARTKENAKATGHYEVAATIDKSELNRGDSAIVEVFITGYGEIKQSKLLLSSSTSNIFENSYVVDGLVFDNGVVYWGRDTTPFNHLPFLIQLTGGISVRDLDGDSSKKYLGLFLDKDSGPEGTPILTEFELRNAPLAVHFRIKDDARPDDYKFNINFTYFNGSEWTGGSSSVDLRVNNRIQQYEVFLGILAALAALVGLLPGIRIVINTLKKIYRKKKRKTIKKS